MPAAIPFIVNTAAGAAGIAEGTAIALTIASAVVVGNYQRRKAQRKARDAYNASLQDRLVMTATTDGRRSRVYGRSRNVDGIVFKQTHGTNSEFYTFVISLAGHEVDAIEAVYFNDVEVTLDGSGYVTTDPWAGSKQVSGQATVSVSGGSGSTTLPNTPISGTVTATITTGAGDAIGSYQTTPSVAGAGVTISGAPVDGTWIVNYQYSQSFPKARVRKYLGGLSQDLSADLIATVGGSLVTSADKFANDASLIVTLEYDQDAFPSGVPNITALMRGMKCYDWRTGSTAWTENPAVIAYDWATYAYGGGASTDEINLAALTAAANACDVSTDFYTDAGIETRPLFQCGGAFPLDANPDDTMDEIVESMAGKWQWASGKLTLRAGVYRAPVDEIDTLWVSNVQAIQVVPQTATSELVNVMRPTISDAAHDYVPTPTAEVRYTAAITDDGLELPQEVELRAVTHAVHAQHIAGVLMRENREGLTVTLPCNYKAWTLELFDVVTVTLPVFGWSSKLFEVVGWAWSPEQGVILTLRETAAAIYDPDTSFDVLTVSPNTSLPDPSVVEQVTGVTVASGTTNLTDKSVLVRTLVSWDPVVNQAVRQSGKIEVQWIEAAATLPSGDWPGRAEAEGNATELQISGLRAGVHYLFRVRARTTLGVRGKWSDQVFAKTASAPPVAQNSVTNPSVVTVTQVAFTPDGFSHNTVVATLTFTPERTGIATVTADAIGSYTNSVASDAYPRWSIQDAGGTFDNLKRVGITVPASATGFAFYMASSRQFSVSAGVSYSFSLYAAKWVSGDTFTVDSIELRAFVT